MEFRNNSSVTNSNITKTNVTTSVLTNKISWCDKELFSYEFIQIFPIVSTYISGSIGLWGIISNVINLVVFYRIGILSDSSNVSLFGLAIFDLILCIVPFWTSVWFTVFLCFGRYIDGVGILILADILSPVKASVGDIISLLTTYIALERFVAIVFPFKVKYIFTAKKTLCAICVISVFLMVMNFNEYTGTSLHWDQNPINNESIMVFDYKSLSDEFYHAMDVMRSMRVAVRITMFGIVVICNATMLRTLANRKFRKSRSLSKGMTPNKFTDNNTATTTKPTTTNTTKLTTTTTTTKPTTTNTPLNITDTSKSEMVRNVKDIKRKSKVDNDKGLMAMMAAICAMFIVCYIPDILNLTIFYLIYHDCNILLSSVLEILFSTLKAINSSCNIFFYYTMSTKYRQHFLSQFGKQ